MYGHRVQGTKGGSGDDLRETPILCIQQLNNKGIDNSRNLRHVEEMATARPIGLSCLRR